jgi:hypothetical protein
VEIPVGFVNICKFGGTVGRGAGAQALQDGFSADDLDVFVGGEPGIDGLCRGRQPFPQPFDDRPGRGRQAGLLRVGGDFPLIDLPRHQLIPIVAVGVAARDAQVAGLEFGHDLREQAHLEGPAVHRHRRIPGFLTGDAATRSPG